MTENKYIHKNNHESGQIVVLMAFVVIGLLAMLGLAIDGGRLFFTKRDEQNAVDAAVLASTYVLCTVGQEEGLTYNHVIDAGHKQIRANGFEDPNPNVVGDDVDVYVGIPTRPMNENLDLRWFVEVSIKSEIDPYFIQFVYDGPLEVTTYGIGYCRPEFDPAELPAVFAAAAHCVCDASSNQGGITITGSEGEWTSLSGALFFSNTDIKTNFSAGANESTFTGDINTPCDYDDGGKVNYTEGTEVDTDADRIAEFPLPYYIEDFMPDGYFHNKVLEDADKGIYFAITPDTVDDSGFDVDNPYTWVKNGIWDPNQGGANVGKLEGLYYVEYPVNLDGMGNLNDSSFDSIHDADNIWSGVTIASTGQISAHSVQAGSQDTDALPSDHPDGYYTGGIIFFTDYEAAYEDQCNGATSKAAIYVGGPGSEINGVMIATGGPINASFSEVTIKGGMFATSVHLSGSSSKYIFDPDMLEPRPPQVQLAQ